jgi:hypothetical protein
MDRETGRGGETGEVFGDEAKVLIKGAGGAPSESAITCNIE